MDRLKTEYNIKSLKSAEKEIARLREEHEQLMEALEKNLPKLRKRMEALE